MSAEPDAVDGLTRVLVRACRQLADAGQPRAAGRLAADGWKLMRASYPRQALHLDGAMHHIARVEAQLESRPSPTIKETTVTSADRPGEDRVLDVRTEIPRRRHELIFESFGKIAPGEAYVLVNDHDPKPLRYQFEAENAGEFSWEYLEEGPEVWRVRIGRIAAAAG